MCQWKIIGYLWMAGSVVAACSGRIHLAELIFSYGLVALLIHDATMAIIAAIDRQRPDLTRQKKENMGS
jgi:hypothetical protein